MDTKDEVLRLRSSIRTADAAYYGMQQPVISDAEYDALMSRLRQLEAEHPELVTADSPTQRIGAPVEIVNKIERSIPMLSLDNVFNIEQYTKFHGGVVDQTSADEYSVEPKIDGLALELVYVDGVLKSAATRGDGMVGEDVTHAVRTIKDVPLQLMPTPYGIPPYLEVRGEAYMTKSAFLTYNAEAVARGQKPFANPRNAAAGALRLLDPWAVSKRRLSFYVYGTGLYKWPGYMDTYTQRGILGRLRDLGFSVPQESKWANGLKEVIAYYEDMHQRRDTLPYEIDGIVVKVNEARHWATLGDTARAPRWAVAWKFPSRVAVTTLKSVDVQVGRSGVLTPVARLEPVEVGGVVIENATLHNYQQIKRLGIDPGDKVYVQRAGDVIPEVVGVAERVRGGVDFIMPTKCPACGGPVKQDGVAYYCTNGIGCKPQLSSALRHFARREAMNIEGLGETACDTLVEHELIDDVADLYVLKVEQIEKLPGFGKTSAAKLIEQIEKSKKTTLERFLFALGIPGVGETNAKRVAPLWRDLFEFSPFNDRAEWHSKLSAIDGIGDVLANSILYWIADPRNRGIVDTLQSFGVEWADAAPPADGPLSGQVICITGKLSRPRPEIAERLTQAGANVVDTVTKKTTMLVAGDDAGSKMQKAEALKIRIISEEALYREFDL